MVIVYWIIAYWAAGRTWYRNKILIGAGSDIIVQKLITIFLFGWFFIPCAILSLIFGK